MRSGLRTSTFQALEPCARRSKACARCLERRACSKKVCARRFGGWPAGLDTLAHESLKLAVEPLHFAQQAESPVREVRKVVAGARRSVRDLAVEPVTARDSPTRCLRCRSAFADKVENARRGDSRAGTRAALSKCGRGQSSDRWMMPGPATAARTARSRATLAGPVYADAGRAGGRTSM